MDPQFAAVLNTMAYAHARLGEMEQAEAYLNRYAAAAPGDANPFDSMGELCFDMGDLDRSRANFERALAVRPDFNSHVKLAYLAALRRGLRWGGRKSCPGGLRCRGILATW